MLQHYRAQIWKVNLKVCQTAHIFYRYIEANCKMIFPKTGLRKLEIIELSDRVRWFGQVRSSWAGPIWAESDGLIGLSRIGSSRVESSRSSRVESSRVESSRVESSRVESSRVESSRVESSRVESSRVESSRVEGCLWEILNYWKTKLLRSQIMYIFYYYSLASKYV